MWQIVCSQNDHSNISAHKSSFIYLFIYLVVVVYFLFIYLFCQTSKRIRHRYTYAPHPEPSFLLPPHTIPLGRPSAPAPSIQYRASNLDWQLVSYMILHMFQCHSPKSSHPPPVQQSFNLFPYCFLSQK